MSGTCHTSSTFESGVFINILVRLPVQQGMGLSWKHPQGALEDLRARGAAWLALPPPASGDVLTNTKLLWSHPGFAVFDGKSSGSDLPAAIWAPACPASSGGKEKRAAVTLLAKLNPPLFPHLWHRANQCKPTLKMQLILWRLRQCGLRAKAKSRFFPKKLSWCWMCRDLLKQRAMKLLQSIPLHRLPPFQHSEGLKLDFSNLTILLPSAFQLLQPARKTEELHVLIKGKKKKKKNDRQELRRSPSQMESNPL